MKMRALLLLLPLLLISVSIDSLAQVRPRRVGDQTPVPQTQSPSKPPVLGGSSSPGTRQPSKQTTEGNPANAPEEVDAGDIVKVDTTLVTIPVSVMDRDGRYVPNLQKEDFRIWEDGVEQQVAFFASVDKPFSVVLMLDTSP
ncbi:MAG TPA: hypothetical protein VFH91_07465, partial [Pyrinomonadaceae bacterium]|nr:hypothetical protein [Pyrinomonadaceae bacterium]